MSIQSIAALKALWVDEYAPNQNDFDDLFDTLVAFDPATGQALPSPNAPGGWSVLADGATVTLDSESGAYFRVDLGGNRTMSFSLSHVVGRYFVILVGQDSAGSRILTWPDSISWDGGSAPTLATGALQGDIIGFFDDGVKWIGTLIAHNFFATLPPVPTGLATEPVSTSLINLTWDAMGGAASYDVWRDSSFVTNTSNAYYNDTGLTPSTTYAYQVLAKNGYGSSALCTAVNGTTQSPPVTSGTYGLQFNGSNYVSLAPSSAFALANNWTIEFWEKDGFQMGSTVSTTTGWFIRNEPTDLDSSIMFFDSNGVQQYVNTGYTGHLNDGNWHHVAMVVDPTYLTIYYDGVQVGQSTSGTAVMAANIGTVPIWIGLDGGGDSAPTGRKMTEVRFSSTNRYTGTFTPAHSFGADSSTVGLWHLDEGTGATTADASGNGNTGTLVASPMWIEGISPAFDSALQFNGSNTVVQSTSNLGITGSDPYTIAFWVHSLGGSNGDCWVSLGAYGNSNVCGVSRGADQYTISLNTWGGSGGNQYNTGVDFTSGWHFVTCAYDGSTMLIYIDGVLNQTITGFSQALTDNVVNIGGQPGSYPGMYSLSQIDEVSIWNVTLTAPQITSIYTNKASAVGSGLVLYYKMNENAGTTMITDISGNGNNGVLTNSPTWVAGVSEHDYALEFDGSNYVNISGINNYPTSNITAEAWINPSVIGGTNILWGSNYDGMFSVNCQSSGVNVVFDPSTYFTFSTVVSTNTWTHLAVTYDGTTCHLYINGVDQGTPSGSGGTLGAPSAFRIGRDEGKATGWQGTIDEFRMSNTIRYTTTFTPDTYFNTDDNTVLLMHLDEGTGSVASDSSANGNEGTLIASPTWVDGVTI